MNMPVVARVIGTECAHCDAPSKRSTMRRSSSLVRSARLERSSGPLLMRCEIQRVAHQRLDDLCGVKNTFVALASHCRIHRGALLAQQEFGVAANQARGIGISCASMAVNSARCRSSWRSVVRSR